MIEEVSKALKPILKTKIRFSENYHQEGKETGLRETELKSNQDSKIHKNIGSFFQVPTQCRSLKPYSISTGWN